MALEILEMKRRRQKEKNSEGGKGRTELSSFAASDRPFLRPPADHRSLNINL